jgi:hypothetical protein
MNYELRIMNHESEKLSRCYVGENINGMIWILSELIFNDRGNVRTYIRTYVRTYGS